MYDKGILSEKVADDLRTMIISKNLQPGDKLPNELEMTGILNVSRSTLREAIQTLRTEGVLEVRRGRGTFVAENLGLSKDPLGITFIDEENLLHHLFEVRLMIEPQMAALAAARCDEEGKRVIREAYEKVRDDIMNKSDHSSSDIHFHNAIAKSTKNPILDRIVPIINDGIKGGYSLTKDNPESTDLVIKHHQELMEAIESGDSERAYFAMEKHIKDGMKRATRH